MARTPAVHQFKGGRTRAVDAGKRANQPQQLKMDPLEPPQGLIQGRTPGSVLEWRVALALWRLRLPFDYQKPVFGGSRRGGQFIDFWVYTRPLPTPVYVQGSYWHRPAKALEDQYKVNRLRKEYAGQIAMPVLLQEEDLQTADQTYEIVRRELT